MSLGVGTLGAAPPPVLLGALGPRMLALALPDASVVSVAQFEAPPEGDQPFDYWLVTELAERPDPCEAFR